MQEDFMQIGLTVRPRVSVRLSLLPAWGGSFAIPAPAPQLHDLSASPLTTIQNF
jgi:hypothetical protein